MDIYSVIHQDHVDMRLLIMEINGMSDIHHSRRLALFHQLKTVLLAHNEAEEATFYTALRQHKESREQMRLSKKEHEEVQTMLWKLDDTGLTPEEWRSRFGDFQRALFQHIAKEEGEIFMEARQVITPTLAAELAEQMSRLRRTRRELIKHAVFPEQVPTRARTVQKVLHG